MNACREEVKKTSGTGYAKPMPAADFFGVSRNTVMRWASQCGAVIRDGRIVLIDIPRVDAALRAGELSR